MVWGTPPLARQGHTATLLGSHLYIFGGSSQIGYLADVVILDTESPPGTGDELLYAWGRPQISSMMAPPVAREGHSGILWMSRIVYFGGYTEAGYTNEVVVLDTDLLSWTKPEVSGETPMAREGHSAVLFKNKMLVFGGFTEAFGCKNDVHVSTFLQSWIDCHYINLPLSAGPVLIIPQ